MSKNQIPSNGLRVEVTQGTNEAVALDELIDDVLHGNVNGALHALHEPHLEQATAPAPEAPGAAPAV